MRPVRRLIVALVLIASAYAAIAPPAFAGTFTVVACDAAPGFASSSWSAEVNHGGMLTYTACPAGDDPRLGLGARHTEQPAGWTVPTGAAARWWFRAPAGTGIVGLRADALFEQYDGRWQVGLSNGSQLLFGCPWHGNAGASCADWLFAGDFHAIPGSPAIYSEVFCVAGPCPAGGAGKFWARSSITFAEVTIDDFTAPSVSNPRGELWTDAWQAGTRGVTFDAHDGAGITSVWAFVDGKEVNRAAKGCDPAQATCSGWSEATLSVATAPGLSDGAHTLTLNAVDRGGNWSAPLTRTIRTDNSAPAGPEELTVGGAWTSKNNFTVSWRNPKQDAAPIAAAEYRICPAAGDEASCVRGGRSGHELTKLSELQVPKPGDWLARVWLKDQAGNQREETAAPPVHMRFDPDPPDAVAFRPLDPEDPARLRVEATDAVSGLARGEIALRREGSSTWRSLPTQLEPSGFTAVLPDEELRDGVYELTAHAWDGAGNERSNDRFSSGAPARVTLPVRVKTLLRVGKRKRIGVRSARRGRRMRTVYVRRPLLRNGRRVRLRGRLTAPGGNPLAGVSVEVTARLDTPGAAFAPVATLTTSKGGRFAYLLPPGPSRIVRFRYVGAPKIRPQTRHVQVRVRASSTMRVSRRRVINGESVRFSGRLISGPVPAAGKRVELQAATRWGWRTIASTRAAPNGGRWGYTYRFTNTTNVRRYRFRVLIPREQGYPYSPGKSRPVAVTVRGL